MNTTIRVFGLVLLLSFYGGANYYIAKRICQWLRLIRPHINTALFAAAYLLAAASLVIRVLPVHFGFKRAIDWIGAYWMGIFIYLLLFLLMADLAVLAGAAAGIFPRPIPQSVRFFSGLLQVLLTAGFVGYGIYNANQIEYVSYDIQTEEGSPAGDLKIVLVSDLHLGAVNSEKKLAQIVRGIHDLEPDIVCIAGDLFDNDFSAIRDPLKAAGLLRSIETKYGVYACLGNHDGGSTFGEMTRFMEQSNITALNDDYVIIDGRIILIGRLDSTPIGGFGGLRRRDISDILTSIDGINLPVVVIDHNPSNIGEYDENIDVVLSGHTHQGQIFPGNLMTNIMFTVDYGHYQKGRSPHIIVTSGAGTWGMPMRVGTSCEIVGINLN